MLTPIELIMATIDAMIGRRFGCIVNITLSAVNAPIDVLGENLVFDGGAFPGTH